LDSVAQGRAAERDWGPASHNDPVTRDAGPVSASRLAEELGESLPAADTVAPEAYELVARVRELIDAVVMTDVDPESRAAAAAQIAEVSAALNARQRGQHLWLVRHPDGRIESLAQAGSGRLNPQAPPIEWVHRPTEPPPGGTPASVEVCARCVMSERHGGSPGRVHGSVLAGLLDEVTGIAIRAAGAGGMTVALDVSLKGAVPIGTSAVVTARYTGGEGRKSYATGEITVDGAVVAEARVVYVAERR
jgi:acyl-coenzyme A thioesterase PaaI-like protein